MRTPHVLPFSIALGATASLLLPPAAARAGVWNATPELALSGEYASNPQLLLSQPEQGSAAVLNVGLPTAWNDGARQFELAPRARLAASNGTSPIGKDAYYLAGSARSDGERGSISVNGRWADDSTALLEPTTGTLTRLDVARRQVDAGLDWKRALTERVQSDLNVGWQAVDYAEVPNSGLLDYRYLPASATVQADVNPRTQAMLLLSAAKYESATTGVRQDSQSVQVGIARQWTEKWNYSLLIGRSRVTAPGLSDQSLGAVYAANIGWHGLTSSITASVTQANQPSGFGTLALTREAILRTDVRYSERLSGYLALRAVAERDSFNANTFESRSYASAYAGAVWAASPVWDVSVAVNWQQQRYKSSDQTGSSVGAIVAAARKFGRIRLT